MAFVQRVDGAEAEFAAAMLIPFKMPPPWDRGGVFGHLLNLLNPKSWIENLMGDAECP